MSNIYDALNKSRQESQAKLTTLTPQGGVSTRPLPELLDPRRDRELESLRMRILVEIHADHNPVLLFTGAVPGEGATTLALHFARELADSEGRPVLLVDADLDRSPRSLTGALQQPGGIGLTDLLSDGIDPASAILSTEQPNLHFLPCGANPTPPADLIRPERVQRLLQVLGEHYACVIMDGGASLQAPETAVLASGADGVVLVVRANRTRREVVQRALHVLQKAHCRVLGVVLNDRRYPIPNFLYRRI